MEITKQPPLNPELKEKIQKERERRTKVYGVWVKKIVGKTDWERNYKYFPSYYLIEKTLEGKVIMAFQIAKPANNPDCKIPNGCERLTDQEYLDIATRYNL